MLRTVVAGYRKAPAQNGMRKEANGPKDYQETRQSNNYQALRHILIHRTAIGRICAFAQPHLPEGFHALEYGLGNIGIRRGIHHRILAAVRPFLARKDPNDVVSHSNRDGESIRAGVSRRVRDDVG